MQSYFIKLKWKTLMAINNHLQSNLPSAHRDPIKSQEVDAPVKI
jgi:hypothetical protein